MAETVVNSQNAPIVMQQITNAEIMDALEHLTDAQIEARLNQIREERVKVGNQRTRGRTLEDALAGYAVLVRDAQAVVSRYVGQQANYLKAYGAGNAQAQWTSVGNFAEATWLLADDAGPQRVLSHLRTLEYGMTIDDFNQQRQALQAEQDGLEKVLALRRASRGVAALREKYPDINLDFAG